MLKWQLIATNGQKLVALWLVGSRVYVLAPVFYCAHTPKSEGWLYNVCGMFFCSVNVTAMGLQDNVLYAKPKTEQPKGQCHVPF